MPFSQHYTILFLREHTSFYERYGWSFVTNVSWKYADRELVTVAALSAMEGVMPQFEGHKECAVFMGNTPEQVAELCRWLEKHLKQ